MDPAKLAALRQYAIEWRKADAACALLVDDGEDSEPYQAADAARDDAACEVMLLLCGLFGISTDPDTVTAVAR